MNYYELLDIWGVKVLDKAFEIDKQIEDLPYEKMGTYRQGYLKGLAEGLRMSTAMLSLEEKKHKKVLKI